MHRRELDQNLHLGQASLTDEMSQLSDLVTYAQTENLSIKNVLIQQQYLKRLFFKLMGIGLITGIFVAMAVVVTIQKLGLAEKINGTNESQLQKRVGGKQTEVKFFDGTKNKVFKL